MSKNQTQPEQQPIVTWLVTAKQAAEILNLSERTIRGLMAMGEFPIVEIGGARRIWLDDLKAFARRNTVPIPAVAAP